jgi:RNA-directed DNA polymerase
LTNTALQQCFISLAEKGSSQWVLEGDIKSCFDRISHQWLEANVPMDKAILHKWLKAGYMEQHVLYPTEGGTPQGGIISPVLANLTLDGLEKRLRSLFPSAIQFSRAKIHLVRYADDFVITGNSKELLEERVKPALEAFLRERGLELSAEKTSITHIDDGFDFLGQHVRKYNGVLLITPSKKSVKAFLAKVRKLIRANPTVTAGHLIHILSPVIRGWVRYHQTSNCRDTVSSVDHHIFRALWRWAMKRHPGKGKGWIREKYFRTVRGRAWRFYGEHNGKARLLICASNVPTVRHVKVKGEANPFDLEWELYFEERPGVKMGANLKGRRQLLRLWKEQGGVCPICNERITELTGWHNHHITWRSLGGTDRHDNRVLPHPNCHRLVHSQKVTVAKPRPPTRDEREA